MKCGQSSDYFREKNRKQPVTFKKSIKLEPALGPEIRKTTEELSHISKVK